jgi:N-dimethylarginine dimethylaminohydrolase
MGALEVIPLHFDDFFVPIPEDEEIVTLPFVALKSFERALKERVPQVKFTIPQYGKPIKLR